MNNELPYRWVTSRNGIPGIAIVTISVALSDETASTIIEDYSGTGFISQGHIEEVPVNGYTTWKAGAKAGLNYAFSLTDQYWKVHIHKIEGLSTDTNPSIVGFTMIKAFLNQTGISADDKLLEKLEAFVLSSWERPHWDLIPDFFRMRYTEFRPGI